jgi:hypothetical protein
MVAAAGRLPQAPADFADRAHALLAAVGAAGPRITGTIARAADLTAAVRAATDRRDLP